METHASNLTIGSTLAGRSLLSRLLIFVGLISGSIGCFSLLSVFLLKPLFGIDMSALGSLEEKLAEPNFLHALEFLQITQAIGLFILPALIYSKLAERNWFSYTLLNKKVGLYPLFLVLLLVFATQPLINVLADWNSRMVFPTALQGMETWMKNAEAQAGKLTEAFLDIRSGGDFILVFFMVAILPAIGEELLFRGILQRLFKEMTRNKHLAIIIAAFLFSAVHMQFYGFVPRFLLGMVLGYLFEWSGSLWLSAAAHFVNNGSAVILSYLEKKGLIASGVDKLGTSGDLSNILLVCSCMLLVALLLRHLSKPSMHIKEIQ
jgi:membrane protease YdiL (CAAX protease family)